MSAKSTLCILFQDKTVDVVFVDRSMLGTQIKFMERLSRNDHLFEGIGDLLKSAEKMPSHVILCIPRSSVILRTLTYPMAAKEELDTMIQFEATRHVPLPETDRLLGWTAADTPDEQQVALNLAAARRSEVKELISQFELAGVPIDEAVPFSAAVSAAFTDRPTLLALADEGHCELCLYGQGLLQDSQLISASMLGYSPQRIITAARQMVAKHKSWLGDEGISRILVSGSSAVAHTLKEGLATAFGLHVQELEVPVEIISVLAEEQEPLNEVLLAASVQVDPALNLIEDKKRKVPISKRTLIISGLCLLLGLELLATYAFQTGSPWLQRKKVAEEIQEMRKETLEIQAMRDKNRVFRKQIYQLEKVCKTRTGTMDMLQQVSGALPEDTYLTQFDTDGETLNLKGNSKEPDRLPGLVLAMPFVDSLSTSDIGKKNGDYYEFKLSVSLRK